ncbi:MULTISPECIES: DNA polymerase III subunit gamma/tau [unclassified Polaromonas]|jgi:DNA polymerase-3 subunit gamma/tau|uniref:DNA polymerase III subunit gamma/tau n=1 Tax=unclassified Polaromonas TaxID=2638319 RepID=UPI000BCA21EE|nr:MULTISPECIES: DNA polymerase III subunit gamma/tau [unclassified Polaromonas]OYY37007.1 MAG: DNA polymerase III, subunit gamma and tau [Polaromonas sp. 35-63-35]OYZ20627.1 MAG: DNA polymerase III, subunit gamma and tau [Polaromonas sp. 16-63-31]OYZ78767.1 MAG: DNA polymerase III, subunit gamma and tau [Polaromonas sp. 24-63-21]OZA49721.1 MAG: DNA polymerase III, subunit gamma and tau [Polaromonas sp. 17-63-33]OZA89110.1 MAG: DNA polymerase III, subunit gamma and tau [Polaromonas sp. 39-63-2
MSYLVLARKYRPRNFSEMVGQSHVVQALSNALGTQRLHHAYLFTGTRGVGKTTISRILAKSLNCLGVDGQGGITATPCGVCQACTDIDSGRFVDYTELDAASNRGVDEIAQLLEQAVYKPVVGRFKVFMIDEVHMLTNTAFNAMLKTLEEPPEYLKFVLATTDPQKVPATVLSRCLQFNLRPMAPETILEHLTQVLRAENIESEPQALRLLARAARGSMRDALSLTDQAIAFGSGQLQEASVRQMLGSVDRSYVFQLLDALARGDGKSVIETSEVLRLNGLSAASTLEEMATVLQRMAVLQAVPGMDAGDDDSDPEIAATARLAQTMPADETQLLYSLCLHGRAELGLAPDDYAALTMVLLRLLAFKPPGATTAAAAQGGAVEPPKKPQPESVPASVVAARPVAASVAPPAPVRPPVAAPPVRPSLEENRPSALVQRTPPAPDFVASREPLPWEDALPMPASALPAVTAPAPAPVAAPVLSPAAAAPPAPVVMNSPLGDVWTALVNRMVAAEMIGALVRELALQSELRTQADGVWTLRVERESLNQAAAREKLQLALQAALPDSGQAPTLVVELGPVGDSPARRNAAAAQERQRLAEETIQNDPFVQDMMRDWGARIVPGSIKPLAPVAGKPI